MTKKMKFDFSKRADALVGQEMFKILEDAKNLERQGHHVYHLELGDPKIDPPVDIIEKTIKALRDGHVGYCPSAGILQLREKMAVHFSTKSRKLVKANIAISPANFLISQILDIVCDQKDRVALFVPCFPTYLAATKYLRLPVRAIALASTEGFQLTRRAIDRALEAHPKIVIVNSGNNPTGAVYEKEALTYLLKQCEKNHCWLLSDETYAELSFQKKYFSLAGYPYPKLIVISSFSKMLAIPAFRIGLAIADPSVIEKIVLSSSTFYSCLPLFIQMGVCGGLALVNRFTQKARKHYGQLTKECLEIIAQSPSLACIAPQAGFYLFLDIRKTGLDDMGFARTLLKERRTAVTPGTSFGCPGYVRASICGHSEDVKKGIANIVSFANQIRKKSFLLI